MNRRYDISEGLAKLDRQTLIFVGEYSPFRSEALYMTSKLNKRYCALVEVIAMFSSFHMQLKMNYLNPNSLILLKS